MRVLVIEDEKDLNDIIVKRLKESGYTVDSCDNGADGKDYIEAGEYGVILMDIMLPGMDGISLLKEVRSKNNKTPIILLTAKDSIKDRVEGLDCGADDYLVKPFAFDELLARIRVLTRRSADTVSNIYTISDLSVDCQKHIVRRGDRVISLSTKEFALLEYMIRNQGVVLSREKIEQSIWNFDYEGGSNIINVYIRYLRRKIDQGYETKLIHTVRGAGYVLREEENE